MRHTALFALLVGLLLPGCAALLGVGAGIIISQDVIDDETFVAQLKEDVNVVWATAKSSLSHQATAPLEVDDDLRVVKGTVDGAIVTVSVEAYDLNSCRMSVSAKKFGVSNGEIAEMVFNRILKRISG